MHAISVYLLKVEDLRDDKLETLLENKETSFKIKHGDVKYTFLGEGIFATTKIPKSKEWQSGKEACINLNITHSHLSGVLKGYRNKTGGFKFYYKDEQLKLDKLLENPVEDNQQPIINLNG